VAAIKAYEIAYLVIQIFLHDYLPV